MSNSYQHWQLNREDNVLWVIFNRKDKAVNTINLTVLAELDNIINDIHNDQDLVGVIITSGKKSGFIAGADIDGFKNMDNVDQAMELIQNGHQVFNNLESIKIPTVALIKGFCLGGGCELALACRYRIADESSSTRIGLPEIMLGIQPGWGGSVRLPRIVSVRHCLDWILSGRPIRAKAAKRFGLVDAAVPERQLRNAALHFIQKKPQSRSLPWYDRLLELSFVRTLLAKYLRHQVEKSKFLEAHYPAPYAVIDTWENYGTQTDHAFNAEIKSIGRLCQTETAKNLIRCYTLQERLKNSGENVDFPVQRVHVIGGGIMGGDIAAWCALKGYLVTLQDREPQFIAPAIARAHKLFKKKLKEPRLVTAAMDRLIPDVEGLGVASADVIIEAIYEDLQVKQSLFKDLEENARADAILATNTSSLPLDEINAVMKKPERLVGIHFFNPVAQMQLIEVVKGKQTEPTIVNKVTAFVRAIDKLPLTVTSTPGFLINRILMPYLLECVTMIDEGIPAALIDEAAEKFGMRMGPVELADNVGLDVCLHVAENLTAHYGGEVSARIKKLVEQNNLGKKTGKGFYSYKKGKANKPAITSLQRDSHNIDDITDRLILRLENEAVACLRENVVASDDLLDAGMIFGTGFAPFRGGPIQYARKRGILKVTEQLQKLQSKYGSRFQADSEWQSLNSD